jgi:mono/diheme cytochrome c family protein
MNVSTRARRPLHSLAVPALLAASVALLVGASTHAQTRPAAAGGSDVTFAKDIAPILQRSCQQCHRPDGGGPMSLITYEEVRPYARAIKQRTGMGPRAGLMPPFFVEKNIGIQKFKNDPSLNDEEIAKIAKWSDNGAPLGNIADMPKAIDWGSDDAKWVLGEPDLVVKSPEVTVPAIGPDKWGSIGLVPTGLTEDRYVSSVEVREINDVPRGQATSTVGGRYVFHHMTYSSVRSGERGGGGEGSSSWPIHEVGRNADVFPPEAGRLLAAGSSLDLSAGHWHSNGRETKAHLEFGFKFFPKGYKPLYRRSSLLLGNGNDLDVKPNQAGQELHAYATLTENTKIIAFEPHLHAPGVRMCLEAIWGMNIQQLSCVGYDHNWVKQYIYADDAAPLLPRGTIVHLIGFLDTTAANKNPADPRNWAGGGRRSVSNMFIDLGYSVALTDEQFQAEMAKRRTAMKTRNDYDIGCPLCWAPAAPAPAANSGQQQGNQ